VALTVLLQVVNYLTTDNIEISLSGDFEPQEIDRLALQYLGLSFL
jgi:predicted Zn-dependent peptidase